MENKDQPATGFCNELGGYYNHGLTKREYFAGLAMQGYLASSAPDGTLPADNVAKLSVEYADALLAKLSNP